MSSTSPEQAVTMAAIAHGWRPRSAKLRRIPVTVAQEFNAADRGGRALAEGAARSRALRRRAGRASPP